VFKKCLKIFLKIPFDRIKQNPTTVAAAVGKCQTPQLLLSLFCYTCNRFIYYRRDLAPQTVSHSGVQSFRQSASQSVIPTVSQSFSQFVTCRGRWLSLQLRGDAMQTPGDKTPKFNATTANQLHSII